jgi:hypothetical protein
MGQHVLIVEDGITIVDHKDIAGIIGGAMDSNESLSAPICLQESEKDGVAYRNIHLTRSSWDFTSSTFNRSRA